MKIDEVKEKYPILEKVIEIIKREDRIENLMEPQERAISAKVLENGNFLICSATGSGKTLIAELAALKNVLEKRGKVLYLAPLRALVSEKYEDFLKKYSPMVKIAISIGDYDKDDPYLKFFDIIFTTYEKADSLIRHKSEFLSEVSLVIVDEIHEIGNYNRGATLEVLICLLKEICNPRIIGLSATIGNPEELAKWLNAKLILSNYRPVELKEGVYLKNKIIFENEEIEVENLIKKFLEDNGQILIFVNSRKKAEDYAKKLGLELRRYFVFNEKNFELAKAIKRILDPPTKMCNDLAECITNFTAFHHAGLTYNHRKIVEDSFKKGLIKIVVTTPTLMAGVNLPARTVLIEELKFFEAGRKTWWRVSWYKQAVGRAGRIKYDKIGYAITKANSYSEAKLIFENYINGLPEDVDSMLANEVFLRMHILSLIAGEYCNSYEELLNFLEKTFFFFKYENKKESFEKIVKKVIKDLENWQFVKNFKATKIGKRVSELYIDPLTAHIFLQSIENLKQNLNEISFLQLISSSIELRGLVHVKDREIFELENFYKYVVYDGEYLDDVYVSLKLALIIHKWIEEVSESEILEKFNIYPGELLELVRNFQWLTYSFAEILKIIKENKLYNFARKLEVRIEKGIKEELIELVSLEGIGRRRARYLFNAGYKSLEDLKKASVEQLEKVKGIGKEIALKIKEQLNKG